MNIIYNNKNINKILKVAILCFSMAILVYFYINLKVVSGIISHKRFDINISKLSNEILEREKDLALLRYSLSGESLAYYNLYKIETSNTYLIKNKFNILTMNYATEQ